MENNVQLFLLIPDDMQEALVNNGVDLGEQLKKAGCDVEVSYASDPTEAGTKDAVLVILASAALIVTLGPTLKSILETFLYRPVLVTEKEPVTITDDKGNIIKDEIGEVKYKWVDRARLIQPKHVESTSKTAVKFMGFEFSYENQPRER